MPRSRRSLTVALLPALCLATLAVASAWGQTAAPATPPAAPAAAPAASPADARAQENQAKIDALRAVVEKDYVIGPAVANDLGFRVAWQARIPSQGGATLSKARAIGEGIFALDSRNGLIRLRPTDGEQLWRVSVAGPVDIFRGAHWIDVPANVVLVSGRVTKGTETCVYLSTDTDCFVLDAASGSLLKKHHFEKLPSTPPVKAGRCLVYGTLGGQVVWVNYLVGYEWRANSTNSPIRSALAQDNGSIVAVSDKGMVLCLDEDTAKRRWARECYGAVTTAPAMGANRVYVSSMDQYLWAFNAQTGKVEWKYFTQSPLTTSPFAFGDAVLQYVPGEGLVCLAADSGGKVEGNVRWKTAAAVGYPVGVIGDRIALWNTDNRMLTLVDSSNGSLVSTHDLRQVDDMQFVTAGAFAGDIMALNSDGRVVRLTPQNASHPELTRMPANGVAAPATGAGMAPASNP